MLKLNYRLCSAELNDYVLLVEGQDRITRHHIDFEEYLFIYLKDGTYLGNVELMKKTPSSTDELKFNGSFTVSQKEKIGPFLLSAFVGIEEFPKPQSRDSKLLDEGTAADADFKVPPISNYALAYNLSKVLHQLTPEDLNLQGKGSQTLRRFLLLRAVFWLD